MSVKTIRVLLADDHPPFRAGVKSILAGTNELLVVGEAENNEETLRLCRQLEPDVLVLDLKMPGPTAVETIGTIQTHCPETKILILSGYADESHVREVTALGIAGYVLKGEEIETLLTAIRTVAGGGRWFSQRIVEKLIRQKTDDSGLIKASQLTPREKEVLQLLVEGKSNKEISMELQITERTVEYHIGNVLVKLGVKSRLEAALWAQAHGFPID